MTSTVVISPVNSAGLKPVQLEAENSSSLKPTRRRINVKQTIDGGARIVDQGFSPSDSTLTINANLFYRDNPAENAKMQTLNLMLTLFPEVEVTTEFGVYNGYVREVTPSVDSDGVQSVAIVIPLKPSI